MELHRILLVFFNTYVTYAVANPVTSICCLLNDYELRTIGVRVQEYKEACEALGTGFDYAVGIRFMQHPIMEMGIPESSEWIEDIAKEVDDGGNVLIHCRGGVGRAGTIAGCLLAYYCEFSSPKEIYAYVRKIRCPQAIECRKQEDFVAKYFAKINMDIENE